VGEDRDRCNEKSMRYSWELKVTWELVWRAISWGQEEKRNEFAHRETLNLVFYGLSRRETLKAFEEGGASNVTLPRNKIN
jgi:hypothetical protein